MNKWITTIQHSCMPDHIMTPEGLMYGIACLVIEEQEKEKNEKAQEKVFCDDSGVMSARRNELSQVQYFLWKRGFNLYLIRDNSCQVLEYFEDDEKSDFLQGLLKIQDQEQFETVAKYIADHLTYQYISTFSRKSDVENVERYAKYLKKKEAGEVQGIDMVPFSTFLADIASSFRSFHMEQEQADSVILSLNYFKKMTDEYGGSILLDGIMKELATMCMGIEFQDLKNEHRRTGDGKNESAARFAAAKHQIMQKIYRVFEKYRKLFIEERGKISYLSEKYSRMYSNLVKTVVGQDHAVNEVVQACFDAELYPADGNHPLASFLFAGPPGVGKTFLSMHIAEELGRPFIVFDMEAYSIEKSELQLIGSETGFKNAMEGSLVSFVADHPDAVILFDEIEKAHPDVTRLFLSVLDGARLENKFLSNNTDFSNTILIFTTNAGRNLYEGTRKNLSGIPTELIIRELRKERSSDHQMPVFPPELCSRFASQRIIMFNHIGISEKVELVRTKMDETCAEVKNSLGISMTYDSRLALLLLMHYGNTDARVITGKAQQFIKREVYELIRNLKEKEDKDTMRSVDLSFDTERISPKERKFFFDKEKGSLVILCDRKAGRRLSKQKNMKILAPDTREELLQLDLKEAAAILVDPYYRMQQVDSHILGLEDYDSEGLRTIRSLLSMDLKTPVYLLENEHKVSRIDRNSLYMKGVEGTVSMAEGEFEEELKRVLEEHRLQKKCGQMIDRRKVFDFDVLEEAPDENGNVNVRFYNIRMKDSVDPEDLDHLVDIEERPGIRFDDVIGAENAKEELKDTIRYLENPSRYMKTAVSAPKGILLYGPPGTGKTMLAKAMAGETDAAFLSVSAAELRSGGGEEKIKRIFDTARKYAPAVLFFDEVDAIARNRLGGYGSLPGEAALLDMFLTQMDGFKSHEDEPVFVVAATNYNIPPTDAQAEGSLDPAFLRRFSRKILIDGPSAQERARYIRKKLEEVKRKKIKCSATETGIVNLSERTTGETIATLEHIFGLAVRNASRKKTALSDRILSDAAEEYLFGEERKVKEDDLLRTTIHEASHAYVYSQSGKVPAYLTVTARGGMGGYMQEENSEDRKSFTKEDLLWKIRTALAGRIGEALILGEAGSVNTGAGNDLQTAGAIALNMIASLGMEDGHLFVMSRDELSRSGMMPEYARKADALILEQEAICRGIIEDGKATIEALAKELKNKGHLERKELNELFSKGLGN